METYYQTLDVARDAGDDEIKSHYRKLAMQWHPDRNNGSPEAEEKFKQISEAYSVLSDPVKRDRYNMLLDNGTAEAGAGYDNSFGFTQEQASSMFINEMYNLAIELTMRNVRWNNIAAELVKRGCPESVAETIAREIEKRRKTMIRTTAGPYFIRSAISGFFGLMIFVLFGGAGFGILGIIGFCLFLSGIYNLVRALYFLVTGNAPRV